MSDNKHKIENQNLTESYKSDRDILIPNLVQPCYLLTNLEYERLRYPKSAISYIGYAMIGVGVTYGLDVLVNIFKYLFLQTIESVDYTDLYVSAVILLIGIILLLVGRKYSSKKRETLKNIEKFFDDNPGKYEVRGEEK